MTPRSIPGAWLWLSALALGCGSSSGSPEPDRAPASGGSAADASTGGGVPGGGTGGLGTGGAPLPPAAGAASVGDSLGGAGPLGGGGHGGGGQGGGGQGGGEPEPPVLPCTTGGWTHPSLSASEPYGSRTFDVPAAQNWVNTGLFLRAGEQAIIDESGEWSVSDDEGAAIDHGACVVGDLVARVGLHYKDAALTCVDGQATLVAPRDGIVFVGALPSNDLGETYETRRDARGARTVTVTSDGATVPVLSAAAAATFDFDAVAGEWVEISGEHVILTLPVATAAADRATLAAATDRLDAIYELHAELRGALPQHGQCLRFFPDGTQPGYMLAGNPIRMALALSDTEDLDRISRAGEAGVDVWGYAHEMGHDFTFVGGVWVYQEKSLESWPNLFSIHALEALGLPLHEAIADCHAGSVGSYASWDAWGGLCFLMQFQYDHGWSFYEDFFRELNGYGTSEVPGGADAWRFVHDLFEETSASDVTAEFDAWGVPRPQ